MRFDAAVESKLSGFFQMKTLDYLRVEVAVYARRRPMKLWFSTAIGPQRSRRRCEERNDSGNLMPLRMNMRSPRFARDDNLSKEKVVRFARPKGKRCRNRVNEWI